MWHSKNACFFLAFFDKPCVVCVRGKERETDRQADRGTERERHTEADKGRDRDRVGVSAFVHVCVYVYMCTV